VALAAGIAGLAMAALIVVVTVLPLSSSKAWWVRMWDFPRLQIAIATLPAAALSLLGPWPWLTLPALAACLGYQLWRIRPYTPLTRTEIEFAQGEGRGRDVRLLAANVLMENEAHEKVIAFVEAQDPDILLLMETDARWVAALEPVLARYPTVLRQPRDDYYGLVFATRLPAATARTLRLTLDDTPAVLAELAAPDGGAGFRLVGLHPRPPVPGQDTDERDAEVLYAARFARRSGVPLVAIGDFNDAAWSDTSQRFKHVGGYLDPRIGRGLYASFNANHWLIRCPIDQLFVTPDVAVVSFGLGPHVGSDHFPIVATLRLDPGLAEGLNRPPVPLTGDERTGVEAGVTAHRDRLERRYGPEDYRDLH
jgi:endonuclease/exonuclease/phosphatase (EEP) superfamily protein YafD